MSYVTEFSKILYKNITYLSTGMVLEVYKSFVTMVKPLKLKRE